jgi:hypothetical protein
VKPLVCPFAIGLEVLPTACQFGLLTKILKEKKSCLLGIEAA